MTGGDKIYEGPDKNDDLSKSGPRNRQEKHRSTVRSCLTIDNQVTFIITSGYPPDRYKLAG